MALTLLPGAAFGQGTPGGRPTAGQAGLRIAHMAPGVPGAVDVYLDSQKVASNLAYQQVSDLQSVAPGRHQVKVTAAGQTDPAALQSDVTLDADKTTTVVAYGKQGDVKALTTVDDLQQAPEGRGRVNFVNTIPDVGSVDIVDQNNTKVFENVDYGKATDFKEVAAGTYQFQVRPRGSDTTILTIPNVNVPSRGTASAFSTGRGDIAGVPVQQQPTAVPAPQPAPQGLPSTGTGPAAAANFPAGVSALVGLAVLVLTLVGAGAVARARR